MEAATRADDGAQHPANKKAVWGWVAEVVELMGVNEQAGVAASGRSVGPAAAHDWLAGAP